MPKSTIPSFVYTETQTRKHRSRRPHLGRAHTSLLFPSRGGFPSDRADLSHGQYGQQKIGLVLPAGMKRVRTGKQFGRTIGRVVVSEPSDAPKRPGRSRSLEVLALNCKREARSLGQRETHWPDFEVDLVDLAWLEGLSFVMGIIGEEFGRSPRI